MKKSILIISLFVAGITASFAQTVKSTSTTKKTTTTKKTSTTKKTTKSKTKAKPATKASTAKVATTTKTTTTTSPTTTAPQSASSSLTNTNSATSTSSSTSSNNTQSVLSQTIGSVTQTLTGGGNLSSLSDIDIASGLKEALKVGANNASNQLSAVDGFNKNPLVKIPFPTEVQQVAAKLRSMGMGAKVDQFETQLNRSAEKASKAAAPIFVSAITSMTLTDGKNILTGGNNAATTYLSSATRTQLFNTFSPTIKNALNEMNAATLWTEIMTTYNKIPFVQKVETDLTKYTTNKALDGLFKIVADEELKIRQNPAARGSELLQKVFGAK